jgi:selenium metabolism protein YedF
MNEHKIVDAKGLNCPEPVIRAKNALEQHDNVLVIVDNDTAMENVKRLGTHLGCEVRIDKKDDGTYELSLAKTATAAGAKDDFVVSCDTTPGTGRPFILVISENRMGRGNDELGYVLIKAFIHTVCQQKEKPDKIIFYNTGVKLAVKDSEVLEDLQQLAEGGVDILVCGTCLNYFDLTKEIGVGIVSNMYDIADSMCTAGRLVIP